MAYKRRGPLLGQVGDHQGHHPRAGQNRGIAQRLLTPVFSLVKVRKGASRIAHGTYGECPPCGHCDSQDGRRHRNVRQQPPESGYAAVLARTYFKFRSKKSSIIWSIWRAAAPVTPWALCGYSMNSNCLPASSSASMA